ENGEEIAKCKSCGAHIRANSTRNGTSGLRSHNSSCKSKLKSTDETQTLLNFSTVSGLSSEISMTTLRCDQETIRKALVELVVGAELPFKFVTRHEFKHFMNIVCPKFKVPSRWTVQRDVYELFCSQKEKMKKILTKSGQRVCLTTDCWTFCQNVSYLCLTAHYIDENWILHKSLLNFCPISSHKGGDWYDCC
ncbi:transposase, partial [Genlisea aurea]